MSPTFNLKRVALFRKISTESHLKRKVSTEIDVEAVLKLMCEIVREMIGEQYNQYIIFKLFLRQPYV